MQGNSANHLREEDGGEEEEREVTSCSGSAGSGLLGSEPPPKHSHCRNPAGLRAINLVI